MGVRRIALCSMIAAAVFVLCNGPALAASITGTVKYEGKVPNLRAIRMDADPGCLAKHKTPVKSEVLVLGEGNTMANVLVRVTSGVPRKEYPVPSKPVVMDQKGCRYIPHVMGIMAGQDFKILNSDGLLHNVHALPDINKEFNMAMPANRTEAVEKFTKEEYLFKIKCDVHPWMGSWVAVMTHSFFDVTGKDGKFSIEGLPAGTYEIEAWHERLSSVCLAKKCTVGKNACTSNDDCSPEPKTATLTISGDETKTVDFSFAPPPRKK